MKHQMSFRPGKARLRATFLAAETKSPRFGEIDEKNGILYNVQVNLMGEAKGHGLWLGEDFIDGVVEQGNAAKMGVKVRFGHPALCSDALGTFLGRAKNFRKQDVTRADGSIVKGAFADIHLAEEAKDAPSGDLYTWTLGAAKNNPDTFGQSVVFTYADFYVVDDEGKQHKYSEEPEAEDGENKTRYDNWIRKSADGKQYVMIDKLLGTDFTDSPAATDGVFSSDSLAAQAEKMLDEHPQIMDVLTSKPEVLEQFLERYNAVLEAAGKPAVMLRVSTDVEASEQLAAKLEEAERRLSGLQSAKDKEIAQLSEEVTNLKAEREALNADLGKAQADLSAEQTAHTETKAALANTSKQLAEAEAKHAALVGGVLGDAPDKVGVSKATGFNKMVEAIEEKEANHG